MRYDWREMGLHKPQPPQLIKDEDNEHTRWYWNRMKECETVDPPKKKVEVKSKVIRDYAKENFLNYFKDYDISDDDILNLMIEKWTGISATKLSLRYGLSFRKISDITGARESFFQAYCKAVVIDYDSVILFADSEKIPISPICNVEDIFYIIEPLARRFNPELKLR
jgi:hypothetical protein